MSIYPLTILLQIKGKCSLVIFLLLTMTQNNFNLKLKKKILLPLKEFEIV